MPNLLSGRRVAAAAGFACIALSACSALPSSTTSGSSGKQTSGSQDNGEAQKSADQIFSDAFDALGTAHSFHLQQSTKRTALTTTLDLTVDGSGNAQGTVVIDITLGASLSTSPNAIPSHITEHFAYVDGTFYFQGKEFLALLGAQSAAIGDHWIKLPLPAAAESAFQSIIQPEKLAHCLSAEHGTLSLGQAGTVNGTPTITVTSKANKAGTAPMTLSVATQGTPYPLKIEQTGPKTSGGATDSACGMPSLGNSTPDASPLSSSDSLTTLSGSSTFSDFDKSVSITAPTDLFDLSSLSPASSPRS